eukprot:TRINITY_DN13602_c0_g1_i2.p1 TRINITY_DN13602_c0_g1~~TRINITY_DN13602_c0_g1_i2.p1  ORF type:complete len:249 (+),score=71.10 TRINITY_DN13602_c0_g1_i2:64-810(+)
MPDPPPAGDGRECSICLHGEPFGELVAPCKCSGSIKWRHQHCLRQQVRFRQSRDRTRNDVLVCPVCKTRLNLTMRSSRRWRRGAVCSPRVAFLCALVVAFGVLVSVAMDAMANAMERFADCVESQTESVPDSWVPGVLLLTGVTGPLIPILLAVGSVFPLTPGGGVALDRAQLAKLVPCIGQEIQNVSEAVLPSALNPALLIKPGGILLFAAITSIAFAGCVLVVCCLGRSKARVAEIQSLEFENTPG